MDENKAVTDTGKAIQLVDDSNHTVGFAAPNKDTDPYSFNTVYYGEWNNNPIEWLVLSTNGNGGSCKYTNASGADVDYDGSAPCVSGVKGCAGRWLGKGQRVF